MLEKEKTPQFLIIFANGLSVSITKNSFVLGRALSRVTLRLTVDSFQGLSSELWSVPPPTLRAFGARLSPVMGKVRKYIGDSRAI